MNFGKKRIEEGYMRQVLKTTKGCPITSLYSALGQTSARFIVLRMRLLFFKFILQQPKESNIYKMLKVQIENPTRGDWASTCLKDIENIDLQLTIERIVSMKKSEYSKILKEKVEKAALIYLLEKRGKKGSEIEFEYLEMADYLAPFNKQTIEEKCEIFAIKNSMIEIPANISSECEIKRECGT